MDATISHEAGKKEALDCGKHSGNARQLLTKPNLTAVGVAAALATMSLAPSPLGAQDLSALPDQTEAGQSAVDDSGQSESATEQPAANAPASGEIVVRGTSERESSWRSAETRNVKVYSNGSERDLVRVTTNIERLHYVLGDLFASTRDEAIPPKPLEIVLIGGRGFIRSLQPSERGDQAAPFTVPFESRRFYEARPNGAKLAVSRSRYQIAIDEIDPQIFSDDDELGDLNDPTGSGLDEFDPLDDGFSADIDFSPQTFSSPRNIARATNPRELARPRPVQRPWETQVYDAYARHYFMTYLPGTFPSWYLDGIGAIFSNLKVRDSGALEYGRQPRALRAVLRAYEQIDTRAILSGAYLEDTSAHLWTPDHAWAMTHFFLFGNPTDGQRDAFLQYMRLVGKGVSQSQAADAFDDFPALDRAVMEYVTGKTLYYWRPVSAEADTDPYVARLSRSGAAVLEADIAMTTRLEAESAENGRTNFLQDLRKKIAGEAYNESSLAVLAEAECLADQTVWCAATAERILANTPNSARGLIWRANAMLGKALADTGPERQSKTNAARNAIVAANRADTEAPEPLIAYFDSFVRAGEPAPALALVGMLKVIEMVPSAAQPRLRLGREMIRQQLTEEARAVLLPVAAGGHPRDETREARALLRAIE